MDSIIVRRSFNLHTDSNRQDPMNKISDFVWQATDWKFHKRFCISTYLSWRFVNLLVHFEQNQIFW